MSINGIISDARATLIAAFIGVLGVILGAFLSPYSTEIREFIDRNVQEFKAKSIVKAYVGKSNLDFKKIVWFDFSSSGANKEFSVSYNMGNSKVLDVFSIRGEKPENIFHQVSNDLGEEINLDYIKNDGKYYLVSWSTGGSGHYLSMQIYSYDGGGQATRTYSLLPDFPGGGLFIKDHKDVFLKGGAKRYKLEHLDGKFQLVRYNENQEPPSGSHVLKVRKKEDEIIVYFDNKRLELVPNSKIFSTITIRVGDKIIIDDAGGEDNASQYMRMHFGYDPKDPNIQIANELFITLLTKKVGQTSVTLDLNTVIPINIVSTDVPIPMDIPKDSQFKEPLIKMHDLPAGLKEFPLPSRPLMLEK